MKGLHCSGAIGLQHEHLGLIFLLAWAQILTETGDA